MHLPAVTWEPVGGERSLKTPQGQCLRQSYIEECTDSSPDFPLLPPLAHIPPFTDSWGTSQAGPAQ